LTCTLRLFERDYRQHDSIGGKHSRHNAQQQRYHSVERVFVSQICLHNLARCVVTFKIDISDKRAFAMATKFMVSALALIFAVVDGAFFSFGTWYWRRASSYTSVLREHYQQEMTLIGSVAEVSKEV
jgi:hypothetical protein